MRVTIVGDYPRTPDNVGGGVESVILYLTQALQTDPELEISVVTLERWGRAPHSSRDGGVRVDYVARSHLPSRLSALANVRSLRRAIVEQQPDVVHAHIAGEYALAASRAGLPWVLTLHGIRFLEASLQPGLRNRYREWFIRRDEFGLVQRADHLISISPFVDAAFEGHVRGQVYRIENPVAADFFELPPQHKAEQILYAGRLIPRKDVLTLLRSVAQLRQTHPNLTLRIAGGPTRDSAYFDELQAFVNAHDLAESVTFLGELDEAALLQEYADCAIFALASVLETAPMVILQALAAGRPVVATDVGGVRDLVRDGETGFVVPKGDSAALRAALQTLLDNPAKLDEMGARARQVAAQRFHAEAVARQTKDIYAAIVL